MKKSITTLLSVILALTVIAGLTACGGEEITLVSKTINGVTVDVPSDFGDFADKQVAMIAVNADSTASISVSPASDAQGTASSDWDEETFKLVSLSTQTDVEFIEFNNQATAAGTSAVFAHFTSKNAKGVLAESYSYMLYYDDGTFQSVTFSFNKDVDSSLKDNITAIRNSIKIS